MSLLGHQHSHARSPVHRLPASLKLGVSFAIIFVTALAPWNWNWWFAGVGILLFLIIASNRLPVVFLLKRMLALAPFVLGVALVNAFQPSTRGYWFSVAIRSALCLLTVLIMSSTTPFGEILRVLKTLRVPGLLITTVALMHRYLFVLADEAERMRRARLSRTFTRERGFQWRMLSTVLGQLFVRATERAERIYDAMCARGWK